MNRTTKNSLVLAVLFMIAAVLAKGAGQYVDVPAIAVMETQNTATSTAFRIHDDGGGAYAGYSLKASGKTADYLLSQVYTATGDWVVDTLNARSQPRNVYLDLRDGFSPIGQVELLVPARVLVRCFRGDDPSTSGDESTWADGGLLAMSASLPKKTNCGLRVLFTRDGSNYALILGPHAAGNSTWVTCTGFSAGGSSCTSWQIEAGTYDPVLNPSGNPSALAWLMLRNPHGGGETEVGEYNVSFRFQVTRQ